MRNSKELIGRVDEARDGVTKPQNREEEIFLSHQSQGPEDDHGKSRFGTQEEALWLLASFRHRP